MMTGPKQVLGACGRRRFAVVAKRLVASIPRVRWMVGAPPTDPARRTRSTVTSTDVAVAATWVHRGLIGTHGTIAVILMATPDPYGATR
jgi:hypothetical protein